MTTTFGGGVMRSKKAGRVSKEADSEQAECPASTASFRIGVVFIIVSLIIYIVKSTAGLEKKQGSSFACCCCCIVSLSSTRCYGTRFFSRRQKKINSRYCPSGFCSACASAITSSRYVSQAQSRFTSQVVWMAIIRRLDSLHVASSLS